MFRRTLVLLALLVAVPEPAFASWRAPVDGPVVARFRLGPDPYAAGQRRGIDLAATAGAEVRAPCRGRVTFAGALPPVSGVPDGAAVTLRCGARTATVIGLANGTAIARRGWTLAAGAALGRAASDRIRLSARGATGRREYVDPLSLLGGGAGRRVAPPVAPIHPRTAPPEAGAPGRSALPDSAAPAPSAPPRAAPNAPPRPVHASPAVPFGAWLGIGLIAIALPVGGVRAHRRRATSAHPRPTTVESTI